MREVDAHPHVADERAELYTCPDGCSTEYEVTNFLRSLIELMKPTSILETGSYHGFGTVALASGCLMNGFGKVTSLESDESNLEQARKRTRNLAQWVDLVHTDSLEYLANAHTPGHGGYGYDLAFLDSRLDLRHKELELLMNRGLLRPHAIVIIHDTSRLRLPASGDNSPMNQWLDSLLATRKDLDHWEFPYSRGFRLFSFKG